MLAAVAVVAILIVFLPPMLDWATNPYSIPLSRIVAEFNQSSAAPTALKNITERDVIDAINSQLPSIAEGERVKQVLRRIARKRRVPLSTAIECSSLPPADSAALARSAASLTFVVHTGNRRCTIPIRTITHVK